MAGKRQHILPKMLLKGFVSRTEGDKAFTWIYRKSDTPFEPSILDIGVENFFYGKEGELNADPIITKLEDEFSKLINVLKATDDRTEVSHLPVAELVAHLSFRTRHLRESLRASSKFLIEKMEEYLSVDENLQALVLSDPNFLRKEFENKLGGRSLSRNQRAALFYRARTLLHTQRTVIGSMVQMYATEIKDALPAAIKGGHIAALAKNPIPEPRAAVYRALRWFVCTSDNPLNLGDFGPLFEIEGRPRFKILDDKEDQIRNIWLPISSNLVLIGTLQAGIPSVDSTRLNRAIAQCSMEYFLSSTSPPTLNHLIPLIGELSGIIRKDELQLIISELIRKRKLTYNR